MRELVGSIKEAYEDGIEMMSESLPQVAHVTCIFSILLVLWNISTFDAIVYTAAFGVYLLNLAIWGVKKFFEFGEKETRYQLAFLIIDIAIFWTAGILSGIFKAFLILLICSIVTSVYIVLSECLICLTLSARRPKLEKILEKHPNIYFVIMLLILLLMILIPVLLSSWTITAKLVILWVYLLIVPLISKLADEGFDITNMIQ